VRAYGCGGVKPANWAKKNGGPTSCTQRKTKAKDGETKQPTNTQQFKNKKKRIRTTSGNTTIARLEWVQVGYGGVGGDVLSKSG